jgi:hypothetical protein
VVVIERSSPDPARPYANLLPIVEALVAAGNKTRDGGFTMDQAGWRCVMLRPLDLEYVADRFEIPATISLSREHDTIHDRLSWVAIEGPGARHHPPAPPREGSSR